MDTLLPLLAAFGPFLLTVMGVMVSIIPPKPGGLAHWIWMGAFLIVGAPVCVATFMEMRSSDQISTDTNQRVRQSQEQQNQQRTQIKGLNDKYGKLSDNYGRLLSALKVDPQAPIADAITRIDKLTAEHDAQTWSPMTEPQKAALAEHLKELPPQPIEVACPFPTCVTLADNFAEVFKRAHWQVPLVYHGGGMGIDGIVGISIQSCNGSASEIKKLIETYTPLKTNPVNDVPCTGRDILVVGQRPF